MAVLSTITRSTGTITSGTIANTETVTVAGKVYTFLATLTDSDGNVHIGASDNASLTNLVAAINKNNDGESATGAGTDYAASMTENVHCFATANSSGATVTITAKVPGLIGDFITIAESSGATISGATLASGAGHVYTAISEIRAQDQCNSGVLEAFDKIDQNPDAEE